MRIRQITASLLLSAALAGCAAPSASVTGNIEPDAVAKEGEVDLQVRNYLSARFAASEYDMAEAARYYRAALDLDPQNADLMAAAFYYASYSGDVDGASKLAQQIIVKTPTDRTARLILALAALKQRNYADVRKQLTASQTGTFAGLTATLFNAWSAAGQRDTAAMEADLKALSAQNGAAPVVALHRALILDMMGRSGTEMNDAYTQALTQNPTNPRLVDSYGRYLERAGRGEDARTLYGRFLSNNGIAPISKAGIARIDGRKRPDKLVRSAEEGVAEALIGIAANLTEPSAIEGSILYLRMALYLRPDLDLGAMLLGARLETLKKYNDANLVYATIKKDSPYYRTAIIEIAMNYARLEQTDQAIAKLKAEAESNTSDVEIWTSLGDTYRNAEKYGDAASAYDRAISQLGPLKQSDWSLFYSRAMARERNKNWPGAEADLKKALELSPNEPQAMNYLGYSWIEQRQNLNEALAMLEKARSLRPFDGYIVDSVGWAYYQLGRYEDAAKALQDAVQLVPGDPTINDHLGDAFWRVGRKLDARFQWNHALTFEPTPEERAGIEKKLQSGLPVEDRRG